MIKGWIIGFYLVLAICRPSLAQQEPTFSHYSFNPISINPAFAGKEECLSMIAINRARWLNFPGSPRTQLFSVHSIVKTDRIGIGGTFMNDTKGPYHGTGLDLDIAYRLPLGNGRLSIGLMGGLRFISTRLQSEVVTVEQGDVAFQSDILMQALPNFGFGLLYSLNDFYVGFSLPRSLKNKINQQLVDGNSFEERNYYFMTGTAFNLKKDESIKLKPSLFWKITGSTLLQVDATVLFSFKEKFWVGPMYRSTNDFGLLTGIHLNSQLQFGYAFDWSLGNKTVQYNNGTHEFMLRYDFVFEEKQGIVSPRHF